MSETYHEIVAKGPLLLIKGYVTGILVGKGAGPEEILFSKECQVATEGFLEDLAERMHLTQNISHLLVPQTFHSAVKEGMAKAPKSFDLEIQSDRQVRSASFGFSYTAYNERLALEFDTLLKSFPDQIQLSDDYEPTVSVDPEAEGTESYSPTHDYEAKASGTATGDLKAILELHLLCREHSLMNVEEIRLHLAGG